ncbi:MAG: DNA recombination protein RmuC [Oscillospiraceae bacterium]|nr:DNA recombination protein RmuC [Oscillospiraceae bacterium]
MNSTLIVLLLIVIIILLCLCIGLFSKYRKEVKSSDELISALKRDMVEEFRYSRRMDTELRETISSKFAEMTKQNFENQLNLGERIGRSLGEIREANETAMTKMQESNEKKLDQMRQTVDEKLTSTLTTRLDSSFKTVSEQLENVYKSLGEMKILSEGVTTNVTSLNRVLTNVKARGTWAEVQLEAILDQTIPNMYERNFASNPNSQARVEFAVKIPSTGDGGTLTYLPIDSKFPMEDYIRLCDASDRADPDALLTARKALEDRVKQEAKSIHAYINEPLTTPFAIMYLATEGLYAEIASSRSGIAEKIQRDYSVMIAGPTTITALLNSLSMGFRAVAINDKANEVRELLSVTKAQYDVFGGVLEKAKRKIEEAGNTLGEAQHRNEIIRKKLKNVEDIDLTGADKFLEVDNS